MSNNPLKGTPKDSTILAWLTGLRDAFNGGIQPRLQSGDIFHYDGTNADQAPPIGSPTTPHGLLYVLGIVIGGVQVNLTELSRGLTVLSFGESTANASWVFDTDKAIAILASGASGSAGGGSKNTHNNPQVVGGNGADGGLTRIINNRTGETLATTISTTGGAARTALPTAAPRTNIMNPNPGGDGGRPTNNTGLINSGVLGYDGSPGGEQHIIQCVITNLRLGDTLNITIGAGGAGGTPGDYSAFTPPSPMLPSPGITGCDGSAVIIPIKAPAS